MNKARSSQLLPLPTDIEETHYVLSGVQVQTISNELFFIFNDSQKKYCNVFLQNQFAVS
jgi:hypothetical protein